MLKPEACPQTDWLQLRIDLAPDQLPCWESALQAVGALSITYRDGEDNPVLEPGPGEIILWETLNLTALFAQGSDYTRILTDLSGKIDAFDRQAIQVEHLPDRLWSRAWLDDFVPMQFGQRLWICPLALEPPPPPAVVLRLDPGLAFGTGTHPTTAMCLRWLDANDVHNATVVDYGCGSGVLGIAALLLGASHVYATDIDPQAVQASVDNARVNCVGAQLSCTCITPVKNAQTDAAQVGIAAADIVIANILAGPLIDLAQTLATLCAGGGRIVLSGLLVEQVDAVWAAYTPWFESMQCTADECWACLSARRREQPQHLPADG